MRAKRRGAHPRPLIRGVPADELELAELLAVCDRLAWGAGVFFEGADDVAAAFAQQSRSARRR